MGVRMHNTGIHIRMFMHAHACTHTHAASSSDFSSQGLGCHLAELKVAELSLPLDPSRNAGEDEKQEETLRPVCLFSVAVDFLFPTDILNAAYVQKARMRA